MPSTDYRSKHIKIRREATGGLVYDHENYGYKDTWGQFRLDDDQIRFLHGWLEGKPDVRTGDSFFYLNALGEVRNETLKGCEVGSLTCLVGPVGDVYPCAFTRWEDLTSGNVTEDGFAAAWENIVSLRSRIDGHEGCPAVAMDSSDPNGEDPQLRTILSGN